MRAFCIADEDTVRGFRLAGVPGEAVSTAAEAAAALAHARAHPDCALLIVTEAVRCALGTALEDLRGTGDRPVVVELPGPGAAAPGRHALDRLVRSVLGADPEGKP